MNFGIMVGLIFVWMIGQFMGLVGDGVFLGAEEVNWLNYLTGYQGIEAANTNWLGLIGQYVGISIGFFTQGVARIILWDYSFLAGGWGIFKWILFYPLSGGVVYAIFRFFRGG